MSMFDVTSLWDDDAFGLTEADFRRWPTDPRKPLLRSSYRAALQAMLDASATLIPAACVGTATLFKNPNGQPPVSANRADALLVVGTGSGERRVFCHYTEGFRGKKVVAGPLNEYDDAHLIDDRGRDGIGGFQIQATYRGLERFKIEFGTWKDQVSQERAHAQASMMFDAMMAK